MKEGGQKKNILAKTLQKCRSLGHWRQPAASGSQGAGSSTSAPASPHAADGRAAWAVPAGYFAVLVGPEKERFVVRARCANHPLFRALLDEAEMEYGFASCVGPLELPCAVDDFMEVMWEVGQGGSVSSPNCTRFAGRGHQQQQQHHGYHMLSPGTFLVAGRS